LALQGAVLVVQQLEASAELGRDVRGHLRVRDRGLRLEEPPKGEGHALDQPEAGHDAGEEAHWPSLGTESTTITARAVTNRLSSAGGSSHFQAKPMSWSIRTRGSVPRIHTNTKTSVNVLPRNQNRPATQLKLMYAHSPTSPIATTLNRANPMIRATHQRVLL